MYQLAKQLRIDEFGSAEKGAGLLQRNVWHRTLQLALGLLHLCGEREYLPFPKIRIYNASLLLKRRG
jgi:hypothetical protein